MVVLPGRIIPSRSAASIIATPMRSFTLAAGFCDSSLATTRAATPLVTFVERNERRVADQPGDIAGDLHRGSLLGGLSPTPRENSTTASRADGVSLPQAGTRPALLARSAPV